MVVEPGPDVSVAGTCEVLLASLRYLEPRHLELLDPIETRRRERFRQIGDHDRYALAAALLRMAVGQRAAVDPANVAVDRTCEHCGGPHGRPRLAVAGLEASISHSGDIVAVALDERRAGRCRRRSHRRSRVRVTHAVRVHPPRGEVRSHSDRFLHVLDEEGGDSQGDRRGLADTDDGADDRTTSGPPGASRRRQRPNAACCRMADVAVGEGYLGAVAVLTARRVVFSTADAARLLSGR